MTTTTALLACVLLLGSSQVAHPTRDHEPEPKPTRASRAALIVDTTAVDTTVVLLPPQPTCDRIDEWAAQVVRMLTRAGRADDTVIVRYEEKTHRALAVRLERRIADLMN